MGIEYSIYHGSFYQPFSFVDYSFFRSSVGKTDFVIVNVPYPGEGKFLDQILEKLQSNIKKHVPTVLSYKIIWIDSLTAKLPELIRE